MNEDTDLGYAASEHSFTAAAHPDQIRELLESRAAELFKMCDVEGKGFINKKDIQRMREPLDLTPDMLEEVFDSLDVDKNGYLTLDEFTTGFSAYLAAQVDSASAGGVNSGAKAISSSFSTSSSSTGYGSTMTANDDELENENEAMFKEAMDSLGASSIFDGESNVKELWLRLRNEDSSLQKIFEDFVSNVCQEIRRSKHDFSALESALQNKSSNYDENVKKLYEEMEAQIKTEKARILAQERKKEKEFKERLEHELKEKEKLLHDSLSRQGDMEQKLVKLNLLEYQQKQENERLLKEKATLEEKLQESFRSLEDSKSYINTLVEQTKQEKRNRFKQSLRTTENIVLEREGLVKELEMLKEINKKLQDERDELQLKAMSAIEKEKASKKAYPRPNTLQLEMVDSPFNPIQMVSADVYSEDEDDLAHARHNHSHPHRMHNFSYDDDDPDMSMR